MDIAVGRREMGVYPFSRCRHVLEKILFNGMFAGLHPKLIQVILKVVTSW